ncbi:16S rRNA (cytidine(1402)-2'-O)-methyltransferase [Desulfuromonas sp. AOP6]|uniref:16S rRNA (cytidine(1402)-2'-O)-methyltransferase n=1 Tax=Desulfuromonas sp. AOP6 TaxID=1566351 RepID=UPI001276A1D8|nr:16S rRNA (cytidine(1402)-2'-O)-methyltransferase [Desulfuromonas sp. AOP6]BCA80539.1 ribosomal RNA small subunit methyltransferase I [Desulfuromonas sp. AOP6]
MRSEPVEGVGATGVLYLVSTPIGNLEDITLRALRILKEVSLVAAEDTRHSRKLFSHYGISTPLTSCHQHNEAGKGEQLLATLLEGRSVALISDAGTPGIADPGYRLLCRCLEAGIEVVPIPGPSAVITALSVSGLPTDRFTFEGFLPAKKQARLAQLAALQQESRTLVFYEAPHRLLATLKDMAEVCGESRLAVVARELTKMHEELFRGTLAEALERFSSARVRGEIVVLLGPAPSIEEEPTETVQEALLRLHRETGLTRRQLVKRVAKDFGLPGDEVYRESLSLPELGKD